MNHKITTASKRVDSEEFRCHGVELTITVSELYEGDLTNGIDTQRGNRVVFQPPITIECFKADDENEYSISWDFGMTTRHNVRHKAYPPRKKATWQEKALIWVTFELEHSFFHTAVDPNYTTGNYAIFGCLCMQRRAKQVDTNGRKTVIRHLP